MNLLDGASQALPTMPVDWWAGVVAARDLIYRWSEVGADPASARFSKLILTISLSLVTMGITQEVRWLATAVRSRNQVKHYWVHQCWLATLFLLALQSAVALYIWDMSPVHLTPLNAVFSLLYLGLLAICIYLLTPEPARNRVTDFRRVYWKQRKILLSLGGAALAVAALEVVLLPGRSLFDAEGALRLVPAVLVVAGVRISDARYHAVLATVVLMGVLSYTAFEAPIYGAWLSRVVG